MTDRQLYDCAMIWYSKYKCLIEADRTRDIAIALHQKAKEDLKITEDQIKSASMFGVYCFDIDGKVIVVSSNQPIVITKLTTFRD